MIKSARMARETRTGRERDRQTERQAGQDEREVDAGRQG